MMFALLVIAWITIGLKVAAAIFREMHHPGDDKTDDIFAAFIGLIGGLPFWPIFVVSYACAQVWKAGMTNNHDRVKRP